MTLIVRPARLSDLPSLLRLFAASEVSPIVQPLSRAEEIWRETLSCKTVTVFVSEVDGEVVATCMLLRAPNLLRSGRQHAFLENVVTHRDHRGQGRGTAVVKAALEQAWMDDCHHVMMQSGRSDPAVHSFYKRLGFEPGLRTAYVVPRPKGP